jgi:hypothetical protein
LREVLKSQEVELSKLRSILEESQITEAEHTRENQNYQDKLEEATSENHRLEDELEIRLQEIAELRDQLREQQKSKVEYVQLAENEVSLSSAKKLSDFIATTFL